MTAFLLACLLGFRAATAAAPLPRPPVEVSTEGLQHGIDQAQNGHYPQAISELREFISRYPEHVYADYAHYWLAYAHFRAHEYALAEVTTDFLLFRHPNSFRTPDARVLNALSRWERGDRGHAADEIRRWLVEHPASELTPLVESSLFATAPKK